MGQVPGTTPVSNITLNAASKVACKFARWDHKLVGTFYNFIPPQICYCFSRSFLAARKFSGAGMFYWAASRHRLCLYWAVSRCAVGREGVSPDLPPPDWESTGRHSWAGVGEELAEGWKISVQVVVGGKIFKQKTGSEGRGCCMGKESRPAGHQSRCRGCAESWGAGSSSGLGKHADKAGCLVAPPTRYFDAQDHQTTSPIAN